MVVNMAALPPISMLFFTFSLFLTSVAVGRAAMLSYRVAQSVCEQQRRFINSKGDLQGPLTAPLTLNQPEIRCKWLTWDPDCRGNNCQVFSRKSCETNNVRPRESSARIVNGTEVIPHSYPSFVRVLDNDKATKCGGTIINQDWVLTVQHCLWQTDYIMAGRHNEDVPEEGEQIIEVDKKFSPPERPGPERPNQRVDLSLLRLKRPLQFSATIQPATLPTTDFDADTDGLVTMVGVGIYDSGDRSKVVREGKAPPFSLERCRKMIEEAGFVSLGILDWNICLINVNGRWASSCFRDSGGPGYLIKEDPANSMEKQHVLVGAISYGLGQCYDPPRVIGLTAIFPFLDWMNDIINNN